MAAPPLAAALTDWLGPIGWAPLVRLALAAFLGAMVGWERERHGRAAGLRTHLLLCMGCTLIMLVSLYLPTVFLSMSAQDAVRIDPGRIAAQALSGLGFLGAGAIIVLGHRIRGLTTAASIWVTAAIGLAVGAGYLVPAVFTWLLAITALLIVGEMEKRITRRDRFLVLRIVLEGTGRRVDAIEQVLAAHGIELLDYTVGRDEGLAGYKLNLRYEVSPDFEQTTADLAAELADCGLRKIHWS